MKTKNKIENYFKDFDYKKPNNGITMGALVVIGAIILLVIAKILIYLGLFVLGGYGIYYLMKRKEKKDEEV